MPTITLQAIADTYITNYNPNSNYGTSTAMLVNLAGSTNTYHGLMKFDLSSIPIGAKVTAASITTTVISSNVPSNTWIAISGYPCTSSWTETGVTWNTKPTYVWTNEVSGTVGTGTGYGPDLNKPTPNDCIKLVRYWIEQGNPNYGLIAMYGVTDSNTSTLATREYGTTSYRPSMTITYTTNVPPNAPTHVNISSNGGTYDPYPKFIFSVSDPNSGDTITAMQVQVAQDSGFTSMVWDATNSGDAGYGQGYGSTDTGSNALGGWGGFPAASGNTTSLRITRPSGWAPLPIGTLYLRARVKDNNGEWSGWSATQQFNIKTPPWSDTIPNDLPGFKAQWLNDIYNCISDIRAFRQWGTIYAMDGPIDETKDIKAMHVMERRKYLQDAMGTFSVSPTWTNTDLTNLLTANQYNAGTEWASTAHFSSYSTQGAAATLAYDSTDGMYWGSISLTSTYASTQYISIYTAAQPAPVKANTKHTVGLWVKGTAGQSARLFAWYRNASNNRFSNSGDAPNLITYTGGWQFATLQFTTPSGTSYLELELAIPNALSGDIVKWGGGFLVEGDPYVLDRSTQHIREFRNEIANGYAFREEWNSNPYSVSNTTVNSCANSILDVTSTTVDPMIHMPSLGSFNPNEFRWMEIRYRIVSGGATGGQIYFYNTTYNSANEAQVMWLPDFLADGKWHTAILDMWQHSTWKTGGNVTGWRYDWASNTGVNMELDFIRLTKY